jgi:hypothetical protein
VKPTMHRDCPTPADSDATDARPGPDGRAPGESTWWDAPEWPADDALDTARPGDAPDPTELAIRGESQARRHREVLAVSCIVAVLAFALVEVPGGRVAFRGLRAYPLPPSCVSRSLLGLNCPGCGLTRSIIHLAEGDLLSSWRCHRLGMLMAAVLIFQIPYRLLALRRPETPLIPPRWLAAIGTALIVLLLVNWLADVVTGRLASV